MRDRKRLVEDLRDLDRVSGTVMLREAADTITELEAALEQIAAVTYGTELNDTDAERADHHWRTVCSFQSIARAALRKSTT